MLNVILHQQNYGLNIIEAFVKIKDLLTGSTFIEPAELLSVHSNVSGGGKASTSHSTFDGSCKAAPIIFISFDRHMGLSA